MAREKINESWNIYYLDLRFLLNNSSIVAGPHSVQCSMCSMDMFCNSIDHTYFGQHIYYNILN